MSLIPDLPPWALTEEAFAEFCEQRRMDENDESWRSFVMYSEEEQDPSFLDPDDLEPSDVVEYETGPPSEVDPW